MRWNYYPRNRRMDLVSRQIINAFLNVETDITSNKSRLENLKSNEVLSIVRPYLEQIGFNVEKGKKDGEKIKMPVLFGENDSISKSFLADAFHEKEKYIVEVEAGRAYVNNQFLKDFLKPVQ